MSLFPEELRLYYSRLFPYKEIWQFYADEKHREWSVTLSNDLFVRDLKFANETELKKYLLLKLPSKIDVGGFTHLRELVFDLDLTDYDDVRKGLCGCQEACMCSICWQMMVGGAKVLHEMLQMDFGYSQITWVFSGRRGLHCWVSDPSATALSFEARCAIIKYLTVDRKYLSHPVFERAYKILKPIFFKSIWPVLVKRDAKNQIVEMQEKNENVEFAKSVIFQYLYPRIDANVTKQLNHLLKIPFSFHPKTARLCLPISIERIDEFVPHNVPTLSQLCADLNVTDVMKRKYVRELEAAKLLLKK